MSAPVLDYKKRPPPIAIPQWPPLQAASGTKASVNAQIHPEGGGQRPQRFASSSTQQAVHSGNTTPLTSPLEPDESRLAHPKSGSQASKHRSSAMTTLSTLMDQARGSPRKSDSVSLPSRHGSTARSGQSERRNEDEITARSQIESRTEKKLFKMTGQIPPTPTTGTIDPNKVFIRTEDLRTQCRAANGEKQLSGDELSKSPRKKLFGVNIPTFSRTLSTSTVPAMPSKAAQILGTSPPHKPRRIEPRPIRSARALKTPTRASHPDTANFQPAKMHGQASPARNHYHSSNRRNRRPGRKPAGKDKTKHQDQTLANPSFESMPPTPPAKDTPLESRSLANPSSPLRRAPSRGDLRESYGDSLDRSTHVRLQFPAFALSPSVPKTALFGDSAVSPVKFQPYTAEDYAKLIGGEMLQWPYSEVEEAGKVKEAGHSAPLAADGNELLRLPQSSRSDDCHYNERLGHRLSPLPPRFYSPSNRSIQLFMNGESPSQNTDSGRMLFAPPKPSLVHVRENSNKGSIEMVYQGSMDATESDSIEVQSTHNSDAQTQDRQPLQQRDCADLATRVRQELQNSEQHQPSVPKKGPNHAQVQTPSMKLTDMQSSAVPRKESNGGSHLSCPSAIPSPLHKLNGSQMAMPLMPHGIGVAPTGPWVSPRSHKTIEDHFFMTNEHLDVVGKTTYDALDMYSKQQISATNAKHEQLVVTMEGHMEGLRSQLGSVREKADETSDQTHSFSVKLEQLEKFLRDEVVGAMMEQTKKTAGIDLSLREIQQAILQVQQTVDKLSEPKATAHDSISNVLPTSGASTQAVSSHHSQPAMTSYYGNGSGRDELVPMPPLQDRTVSNHYEANGDPRGNYGTSWQSHGWNGRSTYQSRHSGETSSYAGTNPYQFVGGGNNGYLQGYTSYSFSPTSPEQPYAYGQKSGQ